LNIGRIVGVTGLLALLGGFAGALGGLVIAIGSSFAINAGLDAADVLEIVSFASGIGAGVGVIAGPALSWTLLRRVPIWRAIGETALAAGIGAAVTLVLNGSVWSMIGWSVAAATLAALRLRRSHRSKAPPIPEGAGENKH
jgi:hypothetical protein